MANWYYYIREGKTVGPVPGAEILKLLKEGSLKAVDSVCEEGASAWKPVCSQDGLSLEIEELSLRGSVKNLWVVLVPKPPERGKGYLQLGPLTTQQVQRELDQGRVKYTDYIWQEGQTQWERISGLSEFSPLEARRLPMGDGTKGIRLPPAPKWTAEEMLQSVLTAPPKQSLDAQEASRAPQQPSKDDVDGSDLVQQFMENRTLPDRRNNLDRRARGQRQASSSHFVQRIRRHQMFLRPPLWVKVLPAVALLSLFVAYLLWSSSPFMKDREPQWPRALEKDLVSEDPEALVSLVNSGEVAPQSEIKTKASAQVKSKQEPRQRASSIRIDVEGLQAGSPVLRVTSDASSHFLLRLRLSAKAGQVESRSHIWQIHRLQRQTDEKSFVFSFRDHQLPYGRYSIRAQINDQVAESSLEWIGNRNRHRQQLMRTFKEHSLSYQREKRRLMGLSQQLLASAEQGRRPQGSVWSEIRQMNQDHVGRFVFPDLWLELKDLDEDLRNAQAAQEGQGPQTRKQAQDQIASYLGRVARFSPLR